MDGPDRPLAWTAEPDLRVGGASASDWAAFGDLVGAAFDDMSRLYVLDAESRRVTVIAPDGQLVRTIGGPGDGPGELSAPAGLVVGPDGSVVVFDQGRQTFVRYGPEGRYLDSRALEDDDAGPEGPLAFDHLGRVVGTRDDRVAYDDASGPRVLRAHAVAAQAPTATIYEGWMPSTPEVRELTPQETGGMRVLLPPIVGFHPPLLSAVLDDGGLAVVDSVDYRIRWRATRDAPSLILRRVLAPHPVTESVRSQEQARRVDALRADPPRMMISNSEGEQGTAPNEGVLRLELARIEAMGFHDVIPVIEALGVDRSGRLWVQRSSGAVGEAGPTDVIDGDGAYLGTLPPGGPRLPDAFGPGGRMAYLETDALGAPIVRVDRLVPSPTN